MVNLWLIIGISIYIYIYWWVVTGTMEWIMTFQKQLGIESTQLTISYFQRGWNHQPVYIYIHICNIYIYIYIYIMYPILCTLYTIVNPIIYYIFENKSPTHKWYFCWRYACQLPGVLSILSRAPTSTLIGWFKHGWYMLDIYIYLCVEYIWLDTWLVCTYIYIYRVHGNWYICIYMYAYVYIYIYTCQYTCVCYCR